MFRKPSTGQTFIEYTLMIGVLVTVLLAMTPMMRRGIQAMVKVTADSIGSQQNSEQAGGQFGQLINSTSYVQSRQDDLSSERSGVTSKEFIDDQTRTQTTSYLNQGFQETGN